MKIAGIDLSSFAVDVVLLELDSDEAVWQRCELKARTLAVPGLAEEDEVVDRTEFLPALDWLERLRIVPKRMPSGSFWDDVCAIGIELPPVRPTHKLLPFFGAVVACLPSGPALKAYQPAEWKRLSVGKGNASKDEVAAWVTTQRWAHYNGISEEAWAVKERPTLWPYDATDAFAIAWACRSELVVEAVA